MSQKEYFRSHLAVSGIIMKDNKVLFGRRCNTSFGNGEYGLVAGHIDGNEPATQALIREILEEVGIKVNSKDLQAIHVQHLKLPPREYVNFFFLITKWEGNPTIMEPDKCDDLQWFSLDALPSNISPNIKFALKNYQENIFYSEFGWN